MTFSDLGIVCESSLQSAAHATEDVGACAARAPIPMTTWCSRSRAGCKGRLLVTVRHREMCALMQSRWHRDADGLEEST